MHPSRKCLRTGCGELEAVGGPPLVCAFMQAEGRFRIGDVFPADDPIARFVAVLAMVNNEWHRSMHLMKVTTDDPAGRGIRLLLLRQQAASYVEAVDWILDSRKHLPAINDYIDGLDAEAAEHYKRLMAGCDPQSPGYMDWLTAHRNVTAHFPKLHPDAFAHGDEEIAKRAARRCRSTRRGIG